MNITEIFDEIAVRMRSDFEEARKATENRGIKGESFENAFKDFLENYLPKNLNISSGILVDSIGNSSRQLDIIISDDLKTPIFYSNGRNRVIPIEATYSVIEIKAKLDITELEKTIQNMLSVKDLVKKAFYNTNNGVISKKVQLYGQEWDIWPVNYYIFAYDSIELETIGNHLLTAIKKYNLPVYKRIDAVCVLDKGVICNMSPGGMVDATPAPDSNLFVCKTKRSLLLFYSLVSNYFNQAWMPNFRFKDYLGFLKFGEENLR
jgi:hypothetical protein